MDNPRITKALCFLFRTEIAVSPLLLRLTLGFIFFPHGAQKVLGWFGGHGFTGTMGFFTGTLHIPVLFAFLAIFAEFAGSIVLILGFFTRLAAASIAAVMVVAMMIHSQHGFFMNWYGNQKGEGVEFHLLAIGIAAALVIAGGGKLSLDRFMVEQFTSNGNRGAGNQNAAKERTHSMTRQQAIKTTASTLAGVILIGLSSAYSQTPILDGHQIEAVSVSASVETIEGKETVRVVKDAAVKEFDEPTFVKIRDVQFTNGTIEVKVRSRLLKDAPDFARGFIGIAFRINGSNSKFESIYLRPTNGRTEDPVRRDRAIQYFAYPDYKFERLRKEAPGVYESAADIGLDEWITMRVEVKGKLAKLFLNDNKQPTLVVNDLKLGADASGSIGLWVDVGTEGFFTDLKIHPERNDKAQ